MKTLEEVKSQLQAGQFEFTRHAFKRAVERNISEAEIREASTKIEVIEDYPDDKYSPSCLLLGFTLANRALHLQVSRIESDNVKIITLYEPDSMQWMDYRRRKP
ncbi:DUF4258 domain-containing protein [Candidatus Synechococcus calcipolaris G9]|uniref:DUF4258 domain-containing protein n=1 Tax=Candidatus Synechococcus calcipolaris G9 TaxID=1497997 RepID=A0ABT6EZS9_9SYNE|nr:DUF4258 domain-containing protein [Candidatus Synechococcus calcipolaris]MDG2991085.1 DUF4258 domain-containing protein [Candidatus Synechococcus calcipolaris G9]